MFWKTMKCAPASPWAEFLTDENVARWIVEQLEIRPQDCVVEVGPGTGSLTEHAIPLPQTGSGGI